jgi:hypothetical protein
MKPPSTVNTPVRTFYKFTGPALALSVDYSKLILSVSRLHPLSSPAGVLIDTNLCQLFALYHAYYTPSMAQPKADLDLPSHLWMQADHF